MEVEGHEGELERIYRSVLWRSPGPTDRARFSGRRAFRRSRIVWWLRRDPEHRRFAQPLVSSLTPLLEAMCGRPPRREEVQELVDGFRSRYPTLDQQIRAVEQACTPEARAPAALARAEAVLEQLYRELLARPPDEGTRTPYVARMVLGLTTEAELRAELREGPEHRTVVRPVREECERIYRTYALRPPSPAEVQDAVDRFRTRFVTPAEQREALRAGTARLHLGIRPLKLEMDVTSQCNLRCVMCYLSIERFSKRERVDLSVADFARIADQVFPFCSQVSLSIGTEPLLNPRWREMLDIARQHEVPWIYMNTNGLLLDRERIDGLVEGGLHGFAISIDAATASTYERIRRGGRFERLLENIRGLNEAKRRHRSSFPVITFNFVLMRSNVHELVPLVELAHELHVEGIAVMHLTPLRELDLRSEALDTEPELCNRALAEAGALAERHGIRISLPEPFDTGGKVGPKLKPSTPIGFQLKEEMAPAGTRCKFPWVFVGIDPFGNVNPCGWWFTEPSMGNVLSEDFESIWRSEAYEELRRQHIEGHLRATCERCPAAGMGSVNDPRSFEEIGLGETPARGGRV